LAELRGELLLLLIFHLVLEPEAGLLLAVSFRAYLVVPEEIHWCIHLGEWLPLGLRTAREHHIAHHDRADTRFNVFLPLFDWLFGTGKP
jgi:sterol desaturase/sphingolipid hydroxylase (fatty acid hydroxylase superfamily)